MDFPRDPSGTAFPQRRRRKKVWGPLLENRPPDRACACGLGVDSGSQRDADPCGFLKGLEAGLDRLLSPGWGTPGNKRPQPSFASSLTGLVPSRVFMAAPPPVLTGPARGGSRWRTTLPRPGLQCAETSSHCSAGDKKGQTGHLVADSTQKGKGLETPHHSFLVTEETRPFVKVHAGFTGGRA